MIIAFCGIDGSGKTTQLELVWKSLENCYKVCKTKQPTNFYRQYDRFRAYVNGEIEGDNLITYELALLAACDKLRHYQIEIEPVMHDHIILSDRYVFSSYAYFTARGIEDIEWLKCINSKLPLPDLTLYIDINPEVALERIVKRDGKSMKKEEKDIYVLKKVRNCFVNKIWGNTENYHVIDGSKGIVEIHQMILGIISNYIKGMKGGEYEK